MSKLAQACELSFNDWLATFPDVIPEAERSKKHEIWKKKLFDKMRNDRYHAFTTKTVKVLLVAAILTALLMTAFVIPSSREFILDNFDDFSTYQLTDYNDNYINDEIIVGYIPDGFELNQDLIAGKQRINRFENDNGEFFTIFKCSSSIKVEFDTENFVYKEIFLNGTNYIFCQGNLDVDNLIWTKNDYVYRLSGQIHIDEMIKISESIK